MNSSEPLLIALDQGTSSSRTVAYTLAGQEVTSVAKEIHARYPRPGWVEQDAEEIWRSQLETLEKVLHGVNPERVVAIGITNQRETVLGWDRVTGEARTPAIVWQCRRTAPQCELLREAGHEELFRSRTGLMLDPYFSGTKIRWLIDEIPGLRSEVDRGTVVFGTIDSWLLFRLTGELGTDPTNASRTLGMSLADRQWDAELLALLGIPEESLCPILPSAGTHGIAKLAGRKIPVTGLIGDQQSSLLGHGCIMPGQSKCTFGTGAFLLANVGHQVPTPGTGVLGTPAWSGAPGDCGDLAYALEGSVFVAGALIQWLRDSLGLIAFASESERIARQVPNSNGVIVVPAFVGLGAPHWDPAARGAVFGLTRESSAAHIVRASLEAVAHQVADLLEMPDFSTVEEVRIDGGMSKNELFCELLAEYTDREIVVAKTAEVTARGAAVLAGLGAGIWASLQEADAEFGLSEHGKLYAPSCDESRRHAARDQWRAAVERVLT